MKRESVMVAKQLDLQTVRTEVNTQMKLMNANIERILKHLEIKQDGVGQ